MKLLIYNHLGLVPGNNSPYSHSVWIPKSSFTGFIIDEIHNSFSKHYDRIDLVIDETLEYSGALHHQTSQISKSEVSQERRIALYSQSDTLSSSIIAVIRNLPKNAFRIFIPSNDKENAAKPLVAENIPFEKLDYNAIERYKPDVILVLNDWSKRARGLIALGHKYDIPTICLQESIISFGDAAKRMERSDYVMVQGLQTLNHLRQNHYFLTGNPRYVHSELPSTRQLAIINCNFTYDVQEEHRYKWLDSVVNELEKIHYPYQILQHPRDRGDLSNFKNVIASSSVSISTHLQKGSLVISRFSSLLHEGIAHGRPSVYFNPHQEELTYDFTPDNKVMFYSESEEELGQILLKLKNNHTASKSDFRTYLIRHCFHPNLSAARLIADILMEAPMTIQKKQAGDIIVQYLYHPSVRTVVEKLKNTGLSK